MAGRLTPTSNPPHRAVATSPHPAGAPFDAKTGTVPNVHGKVLAQAGSKDYAPGLYVCGWLKRGPSGIIGTNLVDADDTVETVGADFPPAAASFPPPAGSGGGLEAGAAGLSALLRSRGVEVVGAEAWRRLEAAELALGSAAGRPREKVPDMARMLQLAQVAAR